MLKLGGNEALGSRIWGYRKGKAPEKHMCVHCLHKGIECEWDKGGQSESKNIYIYIYIDVVLTLATRTSCQQCWNSKIQ